MPLAVELAAARLAHLSVTDIEGGLSTALTLLVRRGGGPLDRQRTLSATLDWSHALLELQEQVAFRRLAVFAGGFDLDAAEHVCGAAGPAVELVSRLVDKSLVEADTSGPTARYRLLEVVRQYADDQLDRSGDRADSRRRHREWYAAGAADRDPDRGDAVVGEPSPWFDVEQDNVRAAMSSALSEDPLLALQIAVSTWRFWLSRGLISDCARWLTLALERCPDRSVVRARAVAATAVLHVRQGRGAELVAMGEEIVAIVGAQDDPGERADAEHQRALLTFMAGDWTRADELDAAVLRGASLPALVAASTQHLAGVIELSRGSTGAAQVWFDTAQRTVASAPSAGPPFFHAVTLAWVVDDRTDLPLPYGEETFLLGRRVGALQAAGYVEAARALTERLSGRAESALARLDDAFGRFHALGDRYGEAYASAQRGHSLRWLGDQVEADRHLAIAEDIRRSLRDHRSVAMAVSGRALVAAASGDGDAARSRGREALQMMERSGDIPGVVLTSANLAVTEVLLGDPAAALRWLVRPLEHPDQPAGQRAHGWIRLLQAHLLDRLGERDVAVAAAAQARLGLSALGEQHGLDAVQSAFKDVLPTLREDLAT
jgi:tetratricopeptide (TPR) repeat protein